MNVEASECLSEGQYHEPEGSKNLIVLHHTVGGSARSSIKWWRQDPRVVGTAYVIERDGTIFGVFPPECWAWHVGVKDRHIEQRSIGIELASEGGLVEEGGNLWAFGAAHAGRLLGEAATLLAEGRVVKLEKPYRGFTWFDAYEPAQVASALALTTYLLERFHIPALLPREAPEPVGDARLYMAFSGVLHHAMLRKDKSDLNPSFPYAKFGLAIGDPQWR